MPSHLLLATTLFPDGEWKHEVGREGRKGDEGLKAGPEKVSGWKYVFTLLDSLYTLSPTFPSRMQQLGKVLHLPVSPGISLVLQAFCLSPLLALKAALLTLRVQDIVLIPGKTVIVLLTDTFQQLYGICKAERRGWRRMTQG